MFSKTTCAALAIVVAAVLPTVSYAQNNGGGGKPFVLNTETNVYNTGPAYPEYPAYPAYPVRPVTPPPVHKIPQQPKIAPVKKQQPLQATVQQQNFNNPPPMKVTVTQEQQLPPGVLPQQFLGQWSVLGSRTQAAGKSPQYQEAIDRVMPSTNNQEWNITGQPGSYAMTSSSGASGISVSQCTTNTAFIRHQYQIGNCIAREAYVLQLDPSGTAFQGVMKCAVVKPGEPGPPRFSASYNLMGQRR